MRRKTESPLLMLHLISLSLQLIPLSAEAASDPLDPNREKRIAKQSLRALNSSELASE